MVELRSATTRHLLELPGEPQADPSTKGSRLIEQLTDIDPHQLPARFRSPTLYTSARATPQATRR